MNKIKGTILEFNQGTYEGNSYQSVILRVNNRLMKFKVDVKSNVGISVDDVDKEGEFEYVIVGSASQPAYVKITGVNYL